jgi:hypothetical protein
VDAADHLVERVPLWCLAAALLVVVAAANGVVTRLNPAGLIYAQSPFSPHRLGIDGYIVTSPLVPVLTYFSGASRSVGATQWFYLGLAISCTAGSITYVRRAGNDLIAKVCVIALFCGPLGSVLLTWLSKPDAITVAFATVLVFCPSPIAVFALAAVAGTNHAEHALFIVILLAIVDIGDRHRLRPRSLSWAALGGVVVGRALVAAYLFVFGIDASFDRLAYAEGTPFQHFVSQLRHGGGWLVLSAFAAWWLFIALLGPRSWKQDRRVVLALAAATGVVAAVTVLTADQTRIFAVLSWPLIVWSLRWLVANIGKDAVRRAAACCLLLGVAYPLRIDVYLGAKLATDRGLFASAGPSNDLRDVEHPL